MPKQTRAPDFSLKVTPDQKLSLADFSGHPVVLIFYPADFSPVCQSEIVMFNELLPEFQKLDAQLLGVSVDNVWSHLAFVELVGIRFPLLSDFHPKGEVSRQYNAYREAEGESERALFVIDKNGLIAWSLVAPVGMNPGADGVFKALKSAG
jgi:peroxiredoxin